MKEAFHKMIELRRTVRKFKQDPVDPEILAKLLDAARLSPAAANKQPLVFIAVTDPELVRKVFEIEKFGAYLGAEGQPKPGEEPTAHILVAQNTETATPEVARDVGAAVQSILMGLCAYGLSATWLRSFDRPKAGQILGLPEIYEADSLISLGVPAEFPTVVPMKDGDVKYWRDDTGRHFVPKRSFEETCYLNGFKKSWD